MILFRLFLLVKCKPREFLSLNLVLDLFFEHIGSDIIDSIRFVEEDGEIRLILLESLGNAYPVEQLCSGCKSSGGSPINDHDNPKRPGNATQKLLLGMIIASNIHNCLHPIANHLFGGVILDRWNSLEVLSFGQLVEQFSFACITLPDDVDEITGGGLALKEPIHEVDEEKGEQQVVRLEQGA